MRLEQVRESSEYKLHVEDFIAWVSEQKGMKTLILSLQLGDNPEKYRHINDIFITYARAKEGLDFRVYPHEIALLVGDKWLARRENGLSLAYMLHNMLEGSIVHYIRLWEVKD